MLPITCEEIVSNVERPRLFRSHSLSVVEKRIVSTDLTLSPFTKEAWSMHFSRLTCVCVFVSSIVLFVTYRFSYDRISRMGGRTSAYPVPRKSAPLSSMLFLFRPLSVKETRKPAFVRQTASGMCCFFTRRCLWPVCRFELFLNEDTVVLEVVSLFRLVDDSKSLLFGIFSRYLCRRCIISCLFVNVLHASSSKRVRTAKFEFLKVNSWT